MNIVVRIEQIKSRSGVVLNRLLRQAGIGYGRFMRWKRRIAAGDLPVKSPGPKKIEPFYLGELTGKIDQLHHGKRRTQGTGELYESYKSIISRREFNQMVIAVRRNRQRDRVAALHQVHWERPDVVWAIDGAEHKTKFTDRNLHIQNLQDLCSIYKFTPLTTAYMPCGEEIAGHLDYQFSHYGPPLFIKRDNGGNLNHVVVNELLEDVMVIPINSPVKAAPYNGAVEHAQGEIKQYLRTWPDKAKTTREFVLFTDTAVHDLNHKPRRRLYGQTACRVYFGNNRICVTKRKRKSIYEWMKNLAVDISEKAGHDGISCLAWRVAAKKWQEKNDLIKILKPEKMLPHFSLNLCHK